MENSFYPISKGYLDPEKLCETGEENEEKK